jgi:hypothetical protein
MADAIVDTPPVSPDEIVQGTDEWHKARLGKVTASRISDMLAKTKAGKWGAGRDNYKTELVAERLTGEPVEFFESYEMRRGKEIEPEARKAYEWEFGVEVVEVGFIPHPEIEMAGCSPDGLIFPDGFVWEQGISDARHDALGLVEIKCPMGKGHVLTLLGDQKIKDGYRKQIMWQMACLPTVQWCDYVSYNPLLIKDDDPRTFKLAMFVERIERDPELINEMEREAVEFLREVDELEARIKGMVEDGDVQC